MRKTGFASLLAAVMFAFTGQASAATFDFSSFDGSPLTDPIVLPGGTFTGLEGRLYANSTLAPLGNICALDASEFTCVADFRLDFTNPVSNFSVETFLYHGLPGFFPEDQVTITIFSGLTELASQVINSSTVVDFGAIGGITSVFFDDASFSGIPPNNGGNGMQYGNFSFDVAPVPLPAAAPLFAAGLGLMAFAARRGRRNAGA